MKNKYLHPRWVSIGASTGRLSSASPNCTNIPVRGWAEKVKNAILPLREDQQIAAADYSQLEFRVCLWYAGFDLTTLGKDVFTFLVQNSNKGFESAAVSNSMSERDVSKSVCHGNSYGEGLIVIKAGDESKDKVKKELTAGALRIYENWEYAGGKVAFTGSNLAERLFKDKSLESRKKALILQEDVLMARFPMLREWQKETTTFIEKHGYIQSCTGRYLSLHDDPVTNAKGAFSFLGQGGGADHVRAVMLRYRREKKAIPYMVIHDELNFCVDAAWGDLEVIDFMSLMEEPAWALKGFAAPVKMYRAANWGDCKSGEIKR